METTNKDALAILRKPFELNQISKLPKESRAQIDERKANRNSAINCNVCGGWHHKNAVHLDYVGHAALTDRLLDTDLTWSWEPVAFDAAGLPALDKDGGLWIRLTVCGVTRLGYGSADGKTGGDAMKERIGDALRNAAMRFGAALDLWHKGVLHSAEDDAEPAQPAIKAPAKLNESNAFDDLESKEFAGADLAVVEQLKSANDVAELTKIMNSLSDKKPFVAEFNKRMNELKKAA